MSVSSRSAIHLVIVGVDTTVTALVGRSTR